MSQARLCLRQSLARVAAAGGCQDASGSGGSEHAKSERGRIDPTTSLHLDANGTRRWAGANSCEVGIARDVATRVADHLEDDRAEEGRAEYERGVCARPVVLKEHKCSSGDAEQADGERSRVKHRCREVDVEESAEPAGRCTGSSSSGSCPR